MELHFKVFKEAKLKAAAQARELPRVAGRVGGGAATPPGGAGERSAQHPAAGCFGPFPL